MGREAVGQPTRHRLSGSETLLGRLLRAVALLLALGLAAGAVFLVPTLWGKPWSIDHFFLRELVFLVADHPMLLSYVRVLEPWGLDYYSDDLEDLSQGAVERQQARTEAALEGLRAFADDDLSESQQRSYEILEWFLEQRAGGAAFLEHAYPINAFDGWQGFLPDFLLNIHQVNDLGDAESYLTRLEKVELAMDQLVERLHGAAERGIVPPRFVLQRTREGMAELTGPAPGENALVTKLARDLAELEEISESRGAALVARAEAIVATSLLPAYAKLDAALVRLLEDATADAGVWKLPDGDAYYRWALRGHTTTALSPDEVHAIGQREVERIHGEMRRVFAERGTPTDDPVASLQALARDPSQQYPHDDDGRAQILADHQAIIDEVWARLPEWFPRIPAAPVTVERVPLFREVGSAGAYYNPPPLDGSKPGIFYVNLAKVEESPRFGMRTLTMHEAVPGHHLQIALAMESDELPIFRRFLPFTAFVEGWALYSERLAAEVGLFPTPEDRLGQLQAENFRAVRLMVDTGLHAKRWSREKAIDTMVGLTGMARSNVTREVERYVVAPGQACAYKIGQLQILELRARAREALGADFDLRSFHALVLDGGSRPLEVLEREVVAWIEAGGPGSRRGSFVPSSAVLAPRLLPTSVRRFLRLLGHPIAPRYPAPMPAPVPSATAALARFGEPARRWFEATFDEPTPVQELGWPHIQAGRHALLIAPTGSGKTLAAFFACLDRLGRPRPADEENAAGVRVLYVSPLKALVYDIERNLRAPRVGIQRMAERCGGADTFVAPRVAVRTGDTSQKERRAQARDPAEILVTTPESLYLILGSAQRETLRTVETVIVDEIHALAPTKRGAHLALSLERLAALTGRDPQRIGLSATARPAESVAGFLAGDRPVEIVDVSRQPLLDLSLHVPVPDMTRPADFRPSVQPGAAPVEPRSAPTREEADTSLWPAIYPELLKAIRAHRSTILFVNSRGLCERLALRLNDLAGEELVRAHHGSIAHEKRKEIEEGLKIGALRAIVATSSLELGIDMGAVDLVLMVESPGAVARGLQRVGRAGHQVGVPSKGRVFPKHRGDLLEATVVAAGMRRGEVEPLRVPRNPLDVLAQQIVAMASMDAWSVADLAACIRRTANYRELSRELLDAVLDMLAGRYPSTDFAELRPRILWDREKDRIEARRGSSKIALLSGGTIPDRGLYAVHLGPGGPRIGELDEEMVYETRVGETLTLGASTWRVTEITRDRVVVAPAPGEVGRLPFWKGEGPGRPIELGRALGRFVRELAARCHKVGAELHEGRDAGEAWLREEFALDEYAARNLVDYVIDQHEATGALPTDRAITIERFRDELGDWRVCLLTPFGSRLHAPWALAIDARLAREKGFDVQTLWSDDGIVLRFADAEELPPLSTFLPEPEEVEDLVTGQLERSALFAGQFRENAARALLLPRWRPGGRTPLWAQRLRAQNLLAVAREFPSFPIMLETYRSCLQDVFDLPGLIELLQGIRSRQIRVDEVETRHASPFARNLVFAYTAVYLYQGDTPVAERRAQALTLDRDMLRDLLGQEELRELLDASVIEATEAELQGLADERRARHADGLHDLLRRVGDLSQAELALRCDGDASAWLQELEASRRAARLKVGGEERWIAAEDAGLVCDALGAAPPAGLPDVFLEPVPRAAERLMARYARVHGPFVTSRIAARYAWLPAQAEVVLRALETQGKLLSGEFHPEGHEREWCDPEVLRRIRRRTLARLRGEVAAVESRTLARFLPEWHGIGARGSADQKLAEALEQLEGLPLPFSELESAILPCRVPGFDARQLDELGALGQLVWVGCGSLGDRDGRVALYRRERIGLLAEPAPLPEGFGALHQALQAHLEVRGASFFTELALATGEPAGADLLAALWDLVWAGLVTNDTLAPLRGLAVRANPRRRGGRALPSAAAGRWSLVTTLLTSPADDTARAHARALQLLERHGVASRDVLAVETMAGGWSQLYPVFREMEEMGKLRRGHFVEGYSGAQFAFAGTVDRLRAARQAGGFGEEPVAHLLAACDPANPFGAQIPWPTPSSDQARPRRGAGARVVVVDGELVLFLDRSARRLWSFPIADETHRDEVLDRALGALRRLFEDRTRRSLRLEEIDGQPATAWPDAPRLHRVGFRSGYKGLELERP